MHGLAPVAERRAEPSGTGCRLTESDGEATRGSSGLLGGAFFVFSYAAQQDLAKQLAVERRVKRAAQQLRL